MVRAGKPGDQGREGRGSGQTKEAGGGAPRGDVGECPFCGAAIRSCYPGTYPWHDYYAISYECGTELIVRSACLRQLPARAGGKGAEPLGWPESGGTGALAEGSGDAAAMGGSGTFSRDKFLEWWHSGWWS